MTHDWLSSAECRDMAPAVFFPGRGHASQVKEALETCARCTVRAECLAAVVAEENDPDAIIVGIRGGTTAKQRRLAKWPATAGQRARELATCAHCGQRFPDPAALGPHVRWTHPRHTEAVAS